MNETSKYIDPNQIIAGPQNVGSPENDTQEQAEVKLVLNLLSQGEQYRKNFDDDWNTRRDFYLGKQWGVKARNKSRPVMNIIRQIIQATIPILTDARPGFNIQAREPSDFKFAETFSTLIEYWWDKNCMDHTIIEVIHDSMLYDAGILKVSWDNDAEDGIGDVLVERIDPRDVYVPAGCQDFTKNCGWVIQKSKKEIGYLKRLFPEMAEYIKADSDKDSVREKGSSTDIKLVSPTDKETPTHLMGNMSSGSDDRKLCDVVECWLDDEQLIQEMQELDDGQKETIVRKKYPRGKVITILPNQNLLLKSAETPYAHGQKPFVRVIDMVLPGEFWGEGEAKSLMDIQKLINKTLQHQFDVFQKMANPVWIVEEGCGVDPEQITNETAAVLTVAPGKLNAIKRDWPPVLQSGVVDLYNSLIRQAEQTSGITEITQGRRPEGVSAAAAIENLQEASQTRIRMKERNLQVSLTQMGTQILALMMQFYREPRVVRITNKPGAWPQYFEFFIEEQVEGQFLMHKKNYAWNAEQQQYVPDLNYDTMGPTKGLMDVKVQSGTALPWAKTTRTNIAFRLFDMRVIDSKELLDVLEWPNAEEVLNRQQAAAQAAQQQ